jgi:DNA mismatch repair protein MutS2
MSDALLEACYTAYGRGLWQQTPFFDHPQEAAAHQQAVEAMRQGLVRHGLPAELPRDLPPLDAALQRLAKGGEMTLEELFVLRETLRLAFAFSEFLEKACPETGLASYRRMGRAHQEALASVAAILQESFLPTGELNEAQFSMLQSLRLSLRAERERLTQQFQRITQDADMAPVLQSSIPTEREGRLVLAVRAGQQSQLPGLVHGVSGSGATVFIEPTEAVALNNRCLMLLGEIDAERNRIRLQLCGVLAAQAPHLLSLLEWLGAVDRRLAGATLAKRLDARPVQWLLDTAAEPSQLLLKQLRHPLMLLAGHPPSAVVANDVQLSAGPEGQQILLITGPNTGGKTVLLKAVGLSVLMARAGLLLPVGEGCGLTWLDPVWIDVGDAQDLLLNLSTFSGHLQTLMRCVAEDTDLRTGLVLLDELGAGTDPDEGAALASAVLMTLRDKGALVVATTHLGGLKSLALDHPGIVNASMLFDVQALAPTYRLSVGLPGASHALSVAERLGLNPRVLALARQQLRQPVRDMSDLLEQLSRDRQQLATDTQLAAANRAAAEEAYARAEAQRQQAEKDRRAMLGQFKSGMKHRLFRLERELEQFERRLRQWMAQAPESAAASLPEAMAQASEQLRRLHRDNSELFVAAERTLHPVNPIALADLKIGDVVTSRRLNVQGTVVRVPDKPQEPVELESGNLRLTVPLQDLERQGKPGGGGGRQQPTAQQGGRPWEAGGRTPTGPAVEGAMASGAKNPPRAGSGGRRRNRDNSRP